MYLKKLVQQDIFKGSELKSLNDLCGIPARRGMENVIISNGKIINNIK